MVRHRAVKRTGVDPIVHRAPAGSQASCEFLHERTRNAAVAGRARRDTLQGADRGCVTGAVGLGLTARE
jgi:hypothetical protein